MPKLVGKIVLAWANSVVEKDFGKGSPTAEGRYLPVALSAAVPLWQMRFADWTPEMRAEELERIGSDDFCLRMEWVLHRGPKEGDTARAFNDLAASIALLSFVPGGVTLFGTHWQMQKKAVPV